MRCCSGGFTPSGATTQGRIPFPLCAVETHMHTVTTTLPRAVSSDHLVAVPLLDAEPLERSHRLALVLSDRSADADASRGP